MLTKTNRKQTQADGIPERWEVNTIEKSVEALIDYRGKTPKKVKSGIPLITAKIVKDGRIHEPEEFISSADYDNWMRRGMPKPGDIVITTEAPLGEVAQLDGRKVALAQRLIALRGKTGYLDNTYLRFALQSPFVQEEIRRRGSGTTVTGIKQSELRKALLPIPPFPEQRAIAKILSDLDAKIELNRRMNETLEHIARAIFKQWFVDFDFPGHERTKLVNGLPTGWKIQSLDEIADFLNGLALQKYPPDGEGTLPVIKIAQLRKGDSAGADQCSANLPSNYIVENGDVLFSWSGSLEVVLWCGGRGALNQHLFKVTSKDMPRWFYYFWTKHHLQNFQEIAAHKATTMGHIQRHHLTEAKVHVPSSEIIAELDETFSPLIERLISNAVGSRMLADVRDTLLPKLMSGEIRVKR